MIQFGTILGALFNNYYSHKLLHYFTSIMQYYLRGIIHLNCLALFQYYLHIFGLGLHSDQNSIELKAF